MTFGWEREGGGRRARTEIRIKIREGQREGVGLGSWRRYIVTTCILPKDFERVRRYKGVTWRYRGVTGNTECGKQTKGRLGVGLGLKIMK